MPYLIVKSNGKEIHRVGLQGPVTIGRSTQCNLCFADPALSRQHCQVQKAETGEWMLIDLQSHNGTKLRGRSVDRHVLCDGDVFLVGGLQVAFHTGEFLGSRAASPDEAINQSLLEAGEEKHIAEKNPLHARKVTIYNETLMPQPVDIRPNENEPVVKPYALPFQRPMPTPRVTAPGAGSPPEPDAPE